MSLKNQHVINLVLKNQPLDDRVFALVANIVQRKPECMRAAVSLASCVGAMSRFLSYRDRIVLSEILRDTADLAENRHRERVPISE
jgi:hypothetical protein